MSLLSRENLKLVAVAAVCVTVSTTGPGIASTVGRAIAPNSDKVDGFHAVGAGTPARDRAGKLVATRKSDGRLPDDIIAQAPDSARLAGQPLRNVKTQWIGVIDNGTIGGHSHGLPDVSVTHPAAGTYCVDIGRDYQRYSVSGVVQSHINGYEDLRMTVTSFYNTSACPGTIRIYTTVGTTLTDEAFTLTLSLV